MARSSSNSGRSSLERIVHSVLAIARTRVSLFGIELAEEKDRLMSTLLFSVVALMIGMLALIGFTALVVIVFWDNSHWQPLAILSAVYLLVSVVCLLKVRNVIRNSPPPFAATRAEFENDYALFERRDEVSREDE